MVKYQHTMQETWVRSLGWEDPLEEGTATHSSVLAWRIPMDRGAWEATVHGVRESLTQLSNKAHTQVVFPGGSAVKNPHAMQKMQGTWI